MSDIAIYQSEAGAVEVRLEGSVVQQEGGLWSPACLPTTTGGRMRCNNTRQGYARERTLKPAGYLFLGPAFSARQGAHA